jgi:hypothetical protein
LFWQNLEFTTFEAFTLKFFKQLQAQGHATSKLATLFLKAFTPMNLYLFCPQTSLQPPSILYGLVYGSTLIVLAKLGVYYFRSVHPQAFQTTPSSRACYIQATTRVDLSSIPLPKPPDTTLGGPNGTCFLHLPFHPQDAPRREIQRQFANICLPAFQEQAFDINWLIIAYSRALSISDNV